MEMKPLDRRRSAAQDLSKAAAFRLGALSVDPALRLLSTNESAVVIQPRVMRVLVALAEVDGAVLSRDDLIARCWDGVIVGDNAINRVISQLRKALEDLTGKEVRVENIAKVGFRLVQRPSEEKPAATPPLRRMEPTRPHVATHADDPAAAPSMAVAGSPPAGLLRRKFVLGAAGLGALAAVPTGWTILMPPNYRPDPQADAMVNKADMLLKSGLPGTVAQATLLLEQATARDPRYPKAWGRLASIYRHGLHGFADGEKRSYPGLVRSAAGRALALDPDQPDAQLALALLIPWRGNWAAAEEALTAIQRKFPQHWYANGQLSLLLLDLGRIEDALNYRRKVIALEPEIPNNWGFFALNLMLAGRIHEADAALDKAAGNWPRQPFLWSVRRRLLIETDRPLAAAAFTRDVRFQPEGMPPSVIERYAREAEAIASNDPALRQREADALIASVEAPEHFGAVASPLSLLGAEDLALEAVSVSLFGGTFAGRNWPAPSPVEFRQTAFLYHAPLRRLADRQAYRALVERAGLAAYWAKSGRGPDPDASGRLLL